MIRLENYIRWLLYSSEKEEEEEEVVEVNNKMTRIV